MPVHLYGQCAQMDPLLDLGERHGIPIVEDAAQAIGATDNGRRAGSMGLMGCFSFYPTKNLGGAGDGGILTTNDDAIAAAFATTARAWRRNRIRARRSRNQQSSG